MIVRIISAAVALPLLLFFVIMGGVWLKVAVCVLSAIGILELCKAVSGKIKPIHFFAVITEIVYAFFMDSFINKNVNTDILLIYIMLYTLLILSYMVIFHKRTSVADVCVSVFSFMYVGLTLSCIYMLRVKYYVLVWMPFICAFGSDTGAYFSGRAFGKHKLAPKLSPKKTVEGATGGVISAGVLSVLFCIISGKFKPLTAMIPFFFAVGAIGSVFAQLGDLAASTVKRKVNIKDYGNIMPGHGGVLDRFDSVIFTAPIIFMVLKILEGSGIVGEL